MSYISAATVDDFVYVWERTPIGRVLERYKAPTYFYTKSDSGTYKSIYGEKLEKITFKTVKELRNKQTQSRKLVEAGNPQSTYELLIAPELRVLSQHYLNKPIPKLNVTMIDIENDYDPKIGYASIEDPYAPISSVAIKHRGADMKTIVISVPPKGWTEIIDCPELDVRIVSDEKQLLLMFIDEISNSDMLVGWNSDFFDIPYICKRLQILFGEKLGLSMINFPLAPLPRWSTKIIGKKPREVINVTGRLMCDMLILFKKFEQGARTSYKLDAIAEETLDNFSKIDYEGSLHDLYNTDFKRFIQYNARDTDILDKLEDYYGYVDLANELYHSSAGQFSSVKGTVALAGCSIINYCHEHDMIVPDQYVSGSEEDDEQIDGAFVLDVKTGKHDWVAFIDVGSLYPSTIQTINISPETLVGQCSNDVNDFEEIVAKSDKPIEVDFFTHKTTKTAAQWHKYILDNCCAISGYGTIYSQRNIGIIPAVIGGWRAKRKEYQGLLKKAIIDGDKIAEDRNDRLQYVYKIKLNSLYGALCSKFFIMYNKLHGESTTGSGRNVLKHQCALVNKLMTDVYDPMGTAIVMGDTDSSCFHTYTTNLIDARAVADEVANIVNNDYSRFVMERFLVQPAFSNYIKCTREIIGSSGIFVAKKHYVVHIVDKEGKDADTMKVMGITLKKTVLPKFIREKSLQFIKRYLKNESWNSLSQEIVDFKQQVREMEIEDLGLPTGINGIEEYTAKWQSNNKERLPGHVAASILWNLCLKKMNDTESPIIMSGTRVKKYAMTSKVFNKFTSICVPLDMPKLPTWFHDVIVLDKEAQLTKLIDKPLMEVMAAAGETMPTTGSIAVEGLMDF